MTKNGNVRNHRVRGYFATAACALAMMTLSGNVRAENLVDALSAAYTSNPTLQAQRAQLRATDENVPQAKAGLRPTLGGQVAGGRTFTHQTGGLVSLYGGEDSAYNPVTAAITAEQPLYTGGRASNAIDQAKYGVLASRAGLTSAEQDVLLNTVEAYMNVYRDAAVVRLNENNVKVLQEQLQATKDRFEVGELTRTDVAQAEARLSRAGSELTAAEANLAASRAAYQAVVGRAPGTLDAPGDLPALPETQAEAIEIAFANNPDLIAARESERASRAAVRAAKSELMPSVGLQAQYAYGHEPSSTIDNSNEGLVQGVLTIPLYQAGGEYARIRQSMQENSQSRLEIAATQRAVQQQVSTAWDQLRASKAQIVSERSQVRANTIAAEGVRQEAMVGSRTTLDVLNADQELLNSKVSLVTAEANEYIAAYNVSAAIGGMTAQKLQLPVNYYDPQNYYNNVEDRWFGYSSASDPDVDRSE